MKVISAIAMAALLVISTIGLSGEGAVWTLYVGAGTILTLLMLILTQVSNIPNSNEQKKILTNTIIQPPAPDDDDDFAGRRSARN